MIETTETLTRPISEEVTRKSRNPIWLFIKIILLLGVVAFLLILATAYYLNQPPTVFTTPVVINIEPGTSVKQITRQLEDASVVRSKTLLYLVVSYLYEPTNVKASVYVFETPITTVAVAKRLTTGEFDNDLIKFTHIEGERATSIADSAEQILLNFDKEHFLARAVPLEGKLYPETYHIPKTFTADELIDLMLKTFAEQTQALQTQIDSHELSYEKILVLASILEREANTPESMRVVSGILQGRMEAGMPLQADASVEYILNKPLKELTAEDLKIDSPYNTYLNRGLPPTPIGNPGINAIIAVLEPEKTDYVFYITDEEGNFHYAETYAEHLDNVTEYLR